MCLAFPACFADKRGQRLFAGGGRLQERARRQRHLRAADRDDRARCASAPVRRDASAARGDVARRCRDSVVIIAGGSGPEPRTSTSRPPLVAVTWMSSGLPILRQGLGQRPGRLQRARQRGIEDRAAVDRHDVVRTGGGEADLQHVMRAEPRMQVMRRRPAPWASTSGATSQSSLACRKVSTTMLRFQAR